MLVSVFMFLTLILPVRQRETEITHKTFLSEIKESSQVLKSKYMQRSIFIFIFCGKLKDLPTSRSETKEKYLMRDSF